MNILAVDLGTRLGYACGEPTAMKCGTKILASAAEITEQARRRYDRRLDLRIPRLLDFLRSLGRKEPFDFVVFEDVTFSTTTLATQMWSSLRAVLWIFAAENSLTPRIDCCPVTTLKKFATGHGGAMKEIMASALVRTDSRFVFSKKGVVLDAVSGISLTDDAVDAVHLFNWAVKTLKNA